MSKSSDKALALMVYETWLLGAPLPKVSVQKWANKTIGKKLFPETKGAN